MLVQKVRSTQFLNCNFHFYWFFHIEFLMVQTCGILASLWIWNIILSYSATSAHKEYSVWEKPKPEKHSPAQMFHLNEMHQNEVFQNSITKTNNLACASLKRKRWQFRIILWPTSCSTSHGYFKRGRTHKAGRPSTNTLAQ